MRSGRVMRNQAAHRIVSAPRAQGTSPVERMEPGLPRFGT